jgi:glycerol uptake facilitator-like aquaporin
MIRMSTAANAAASPSQQGGFRRFWRAMKQLFHEVIAGVFAVLALGWFNAAFRAWSRDVAHWLIGMAVAVALLFVFFAVTSFRRARKV